MTLQAVAGFLGQSGLQHPANLYRNLVGALAGKRSGFFRYNDFAFSPNGSNMSLVIGPGDAVLMGTEAVSTQGGYYVWNNANESIAWPAAPGSNSRIDSLILRVIDTDYGTDPAGSKATWEIVSGTPAASPSAVADSAFAPAGTYYHPGAWLRVANFQVSAGQTNLAAATLTHLRRYARVGRHTINLSNAYPTDPQLGDTVTQVGGVANGVLHHYNGTSWTAAGASVWDNWTPVYYSNVDTGAGGLTVTTTYSRIMKVGDTVYMQGSAQITAGTGTGVGISLPFNPARRQITAGNMYFTGTGAPTDQTMNAVMSTNSPWNRATPSRLNNSFGSFSSTPVGLHWSLMYEAA